MTSLADACYRLALLVFPRSFRRRHGAAMLDQFRAQRQLLQGRRTALVMLWIHAIIDAIGHGLACRFEATSEPGGHPMRALGRDLRCTWRTIRARPGACLATVVVLALGIGLTSAIFALADPFMSRPLPYVDADRLVIISLNSENRRQGQFPRPSDFAARTDLFKSVAAYTPIDVHRLRVRVADGDVMLMAAAVSESFFTVLGVPVTLPPEWEAAQTAGETPLVLLAGADQRTRQLPVGSALRTQDGTVVRIVGALDEQFVFPRNRVSPALSAIVPLPDDPLMDVRVGPSGRSFSSTSRDVIARVQDGVTPQLVESALEPPESDERAYSVAVQSLNTYLTARLEQLAWGAFAAALLIALACAANVANLLVARGASRAVELSTRKALGASRADLAHLIFVELALLSLAGAALGLLCAHLALKAANMVMPPEFIALGAPAVTARVTMFALGLGAAIMCVAVLPAAAIVWRLAPPSLLEHRTAGDSLQVRALRFGMTAGQSAVAMLLVVGAALLGRSFLNLALQDTGYSGDPMVVSVSYPATLRGAALQDDIDRTIDRLHRVPNVTIASAAVGSMVGGSTAGTFLRADGKARMVQTKSVTARYFDVVGSRIVAGRALDWRDRGSQGVILNRHLAAELWPGEVALGRTVTWRNRPATVVGVVQDTFERALDVPPGPMVFSFLDGPTIGNSVSYVIRANAALGTMRGALQRAVAEVNRDAIVTDMSGVADRLAASVHDRLFASLVATMFATAGIGVSAFGLAGVVAFVVTRRTREIAIRMAIGASPRHVSRLVVRQALMAALIGAAVGLVAGWWASRWLESLLYGVRAGDTLTLAMGGLVMLAVVVVAAWLPSRRALALSPTIALKIE